MTDLPVSYRGMRETDKGLIVTSWLKSYRPSVPWIGRDDFYRLYRTVINELLDKDGVTSVVVCSPDDEDHVIGWACTEPARSLLHYIFVKSDYRKLGIAKAIREHIGLTRCLYATHWTYDWCYLAGCIDLHPGYRPDLLYKDNHRRSNGDGNPCNRSANRKRVLAQSA